MKKLMYILLFLLMAANVAAQESYVIDSVCTGANRFYRIDTKEKGSTWEWHIKDTLGNEIANPAYTDFLIESSPGDTTWGSEINYTWNDIGVFHILTLHYSEHGCDTLEQGIVNVYEAPGAIAGDDMIICSNATVTLSNDSAWNYSKLIWTTTGDGTFADNTLIHPTYFPGTADMTSGSVTLILTANGLAVNVTCDPAVDSVKIHLSNPAIALSKADLLCYNDSSGWIKATVTGGIEPYIYSWSGPGTFTSTGDSIYGLAAGKYWLLVTDSIGCTVTDSIEITEPLELLATASADTTEICDDGVISLNATAAGGTGSLTHLWTGTGAVYLDATDNLSVLFQGAVAGIYTLIYNVTDENGCVAADTVEVTVLPLVIPLLAEIDTLCEFSIAPALPPTDLNGITGTWLPDKIMTDVAGTFDFIFTPDASYKCSETDTISVVVMPNIIPLLAEIDTLCEFSIAPLLPSTDLNGISGTWSPDIIKTDLAGTYDYIFTPDSSYVCFVTDTITVVVIPSVIPLLAEIDTLCEFSIAPMLPLTDLNGISGTWSPDAIMTDVAGTFDFIFTPDPSYFCFVSDTISVVVIPNVIPLLTQRDTLCEYSIAPSLPLTDLNGITGTWSPDTIITNIAGTYNFIFTPDPSYRCFETDTITIFIQPNIYPILAEIDTLCEFSIAPLLPSTDLNGISGTWSPEFISTNVAGTYDYEFTPDSSYRCFRVDKISIVVIPSVIPLLAEIDTLCEFSIAPALPTTDLNGITGTWSPDTIMTDVAGTFDFIFTPDSSYICFVSDTISVVVFPPVIPLLAEIDTLCEFSLAPQLPLTDLNGIRGTWSPDTILTDVAGTFDFVFTPDSSYICFEVDTISVVVIPTVIPLLAEMDTLCEFSIAPMLPLTDLNGITGTWSPDTIMTNVAGTYDFIFTPDLSYICFVTDTISVVVIPSVIPLLAEIDTLCEFSIAPALPPTDLNGITGTWSPDTIVTDVAGSYEFIFTPDSSYICFVTDTIVVVVVPTVIPLLAEIDTLCEFSIAPLLPPTDLNGITGTWTPDTIMTDVAGTYSFIFTPDSSYICFEVDTISVVVIPSVIPLLAKIDTLCQFSIAPMLPLTDLNGITGTWMPATIKTDVAGTFDFIFTPDSSYVCFVSDTISVVIMPTIVADVSPMGPFCQYEIAPSLPSTDLNGITGTWSPDTIMTGSTGKFEYIFTPDSSYRCLKADTIFIDIITPIIANLSSPGPFCQYEIAPSLPPTDLNGITGTWSPDTIITDVAGIFDYVFTPDSSYGCFVKDTISVVITPTIIADIAQMGPYCQNEIAPLLPSVDLNNVSGTWMPDKIMTDSVGLFEYIFTPDSTYQCFVPDTIWIEIRGTTSSVTDTTIFATELPFIWNENSYNTEGTYYLNKINANGCDSLLTLILHIIYTTDVIDTTICVQDLPVVWNGKEYYTEGLHPDTLTAISGSDSIVFLNIIFIPEITPVFELLGPYCQFSVPDTLPLTSQNGITGTWSQTGINTSVFGTQLLTFTPNPGLCAVVVPMEIKIIEQFEVSVTIVADKVEIDDGETVTFTATPVNGGTSPVYAWFVNGVEILGETSVTFSYKPQNNDIIYAVLTSDLTCTKNNPATSNEIIIKVNGAPVPVSVTIAANQTEICGNEFVTFTATPVNGGTNPVYAWYVNGVVVPGQTGVTYTYQPQHADVVFAILTSSLTEVTGNPATSNEITIIVTDELAVSVSIISDKTEICEGETVIFTARPVNGGTNPEYAWFVNGIQIAGESSVTFAYKPQNSDLVHATLTSDLSCATNNPATSNKIPIKVNDNATVSVFLTSDDNDICESEPVTFTAIPSNGGTNPVYTWFINSKEVPGITSATMIYTPLDNDKIYVVLTSNLICTTDDKAFSNIITINVTAGLPVSVSIVADKTEICEGEMVTYTATPINGGTNPVYAWFVNGVGVPGATTANYIYSPKKGDEVYAMLTSNIVCALGNPATSNKITILVNDKLPVSVTIDADFTFICEGATVIFTATPVNGGTNPVYAWFVNNVAVPGTTTETFTYEPKDGDEVYVLLTSNLGCISGSPATSNKIKITVTVQLPVSVSIVANDNNICEGDTVTFTATPVNGGTNPGYEWFVNGVSVPGATSAVMAYPPQNGDEVYVVLTSDLGCVSGNPATSNKITIIVNDKLPVSVSIVADKTEICEGEMVTFTATPTNGGTNPVYAWFVNDIKIAGEDDIVFKYKTEDGDVVYATLLSDLSCASGNPATSNQITITVIDEQPVAVSIVADKTNICDGETVNFTATPVNGGVNPVYSWFVNNVKINGATTETYSYKPKDGDVVHTLMLSDLTCVTGNPATSNKITITASDKIEVKIEIVADLDLVCKGEPVTFTSVSTNGGTNPVYSWFVNNVKIAGADSDAFTYIPDNKDKVFATLESDLVCIAQKTDTSNVIVITVGDTIPPVAISRNVTIYLDVEGKASITTAQINNGSYDNCELDTLYLSRYDFDCDDVGKNPVTLTAIDAVGLTGTTVATVTVLDTISPVVICRGPFEIQLDENAEYKLTVVEVLDSVSDNCGAFDTMYVYPHQLDCDHIGLTTITLMVTDVNGNSSYCQTEVMIYGNRPPTVEDDSARTIENVPVVIDIIENDYDEKTSIDISTLAISIKPRYGTVSINPVNGDLTYTPNRNFSGVDVLQYRICDDGIPCEPECGTAFVYILVEPVNDKPLAVDDYYNASCFSVTRNVLDNDSDPDGTDNLYINTTPLVAPNHGELIIDPDGTISYFPNEGYIGIDSFQYVICDNGIPTLCDSAWVYIEVDCSEETKDPLDCELFIPEGFSPNEDGIHDFFRIMCIHNYPNAKLMIFNRNGDLLWQKQNYGNYEVWGDQYNAWWWGTSVLSRYDIGRQVINGDPKLKVGNYIYVLDLGNGAIKNGTVMISY
jgi:gliding motility-associated-like protein